ncbi:Gag polyprotein [Bienertia sinuspersici]
MDKCNDWGWYNRSNLSTNSQTESNIVPIDMDDVADEINFWSSTIVCYVLGANPPFSVMNSFCNRIWGKAGEGTPRLISFQNEKGNLIQQPIKYEWRPTYCTNCKRYGHPVDQCNKRPTKKIRKPKPVQPQQHVTTTHNQTDTGATN